MHAVIFFFKLCSKDQAKQRQKKGSVKRGPIEPIQSTYATPMAILCQFTFHHVHLSTPVAAPECLGGLSTWLLFEAVRIMMLCKSVIIIKLS